MVLRLNTLLIFASGQGFFMKASSLSVLILLLFSYFAIGAAAQESPPAQHEHATDHTSQTAPDGTMPDMPGMQHGTHQPATFIDEILHHSTAGTSAQPNS